jgi:hypothetical protein
LGFHSLTSIFILYRQPIHENTKCVYLFKGLIIVDLLNKILSTVDAACRDWSKAGELGCESAYESIQQNCNE